MWWLIAGVVLVSIVAAVGVWQERGTLGEWALVLAMFVVSAVLLAARLWGGG